MHATQSRSLIGCRLPVFNISCLKSTCSISQLLLKIKFVEGNTQKSIQFQGNTDHLAELAKSRRMEDSCPNAILTAYLVSGSQTLAGRESLVNCLVPTPNAALFCFMAECKQAVSKSSVRALTAKRCAEDNKDHEKHKTTRQGQSTKMKIGKSLVPRPAKVVWERDYNTTVSLLQLPRPFG